MKVGDHTHDVKLKVHNTKCSIDVARKSGTLKERFEHLHNLTVGEYFAEHIISKIVERIDKSFDISTLNLHLKRLANEGKKAAKVKVVKKNCKECKKDVKNTKIIECYSCKQSTHFNCLTNGISDERKEILSKKNEFQRGTCRVYPNQIIDALVDLTSGDEPNTFRCEKCNFNHKEKSKVDEHVSLTHQFLCTECSIDFGDKKSLEQHNIDVHDQRGTKRHRLDTSLVFDPRPCQRCELSKSETEDLKTHLSDTKEELEEIKKNLGSLSNVLNEKEAALEFLKWKLWNQMKQIKY